MALAVRHAFEKLGMETAFSGCWGKNPASSRVLEKNGFTPIDPVLNDGEYGQRFVGEIIKRYRLNREGKGT